MFYVGIDIAKAFSVCSVIDEKDEMISKALIADATNKLLTNFIISPFIYFN